MSGSTIGTIFRVTTFGESHGAAIGAIIDGCPAGLSIPEGYISRELMKRRPIAGISGARAEEDDPVALSGICGGVTTGTPICVIIENKNHNPSEYDALKNIYRPSHADYAYDRKYGFRDARGGGRASGRETAARVAAGAIAKLVLRELGVGVIAYTRAIGDVFCDADYVSEEATYSNPFRFPGLSACEEAEKLIAELRREGDSGGGLIECVVHGLPAGIGEPVFDKLDAELGRAIMSIGAVKGVEFGAGFLSAKLRGSENNDVFYREGGGVKKRTNNAGGILGGISDGSDIIFRAAVKPIPSIRRAQETVDSRGNAATLRINGRHDITAVPRIVPVVEAMTDIVLADMLLRNQSSTMQKLIKSYSEDI